MYVFVLSLLSIQFNFSDLLQQIHKVANEVSLAQQQISSHCLKRKKAKKYKFKASKVKPLKNKEITISHFN